MAKTKVGETQPTEPKRAVLLGKKRSVKPLKQVDEYAFGRGLRDACPRVDHAQWKPHAARRNPVDWIRESNRARIPHLVPIRHARMIQSPFAFFRGSALNMAADLAQTPTTGVHVQVCGDCHLMNFGAYATPERRVVFDINDLDETLEAPWEWDIKRLAVSFVLACRDNGFSEDVARESVLACVRAYRNRMAEYRDMHVLDIWNDRIDVKEVMRRSQDEEAKARFRKRLRKARQRNVLEDDFPELVSHEGESPRIRENPPLIFHFRDKRINEWLTPFKKAFAHYRATLQPDRRQLLDRFELVDFAIKVVGVGSVGTFCGIILLMAGNDDPLFLQFKQAKKSVLEAFVGKSKHANHGERIVHGHRMMQSASDLFLGWAEGQKGRHFYVRQLRDMKIKPLVETFSTSVMREYADLCGWTLAHAHARSGSPSKLSGYLGKSDQFDQAIADFAKSYADQTELDYQVMVKAVKKGELEIDDDA